MNVHMTDTLVMYFMFINKVPFLITISRNLKFGTLNDWKVNTIIQKLKLIVRMYKHHGFLIETILVDPEFEAIFPWFPNLNCCGVDEHIPDVRDTYTQPRTRLPSLHIPLHPTSDADSPGENCSVMAECLPSMRRSV